jgi:hypothetical protein
LPALLLSALPLHLWALVMAHMWRPDPLEAAERRMEASITLHRLAMDRGYWCVPKHSNIDKRYYAEVNRNELNPDGSYKHTYFNLKLGTGDTPMEAAADGYQQVLGDDPAMTLPIINARLAALVTQLQTFAEGRARYLKLAAALDDLTSLMPMVKERVPASQAKFVNIVIRDEDDDL